MSLSSLFTLFLKNDVLKNQTIDSWSPNDDMWFRCGEHVTTQCGFYINPKGEICCAHNSPPGKIYESKI